MPKVNSIRLPGLSTGMDTDNMIKQMLTKDQSKVDKMKQKEQTIKWQQEICRDSIKEMQGFYDKYITTASPNCIISSKNWSTISVSSSDENVITATGSAGAVSADYTFNVVKLAEPAKASVKLNLSDGVKTKLSDVGLKLTESKKFKINFGKDSSGNDLKSTEITIDQTDTVASMIQKINESTSGEIKASYSEMTGEFSIENNKTGVNSKIEIIDVNADGTEKNPKTSSSLDFLQLKTTDGDRNLVDFKGIATGKNSNIVVTSKDGSFTKTLTDKESNTFAIDGVTYTVTSTGTSKLTSKPDTKSVVDNMKAFVEDYNKIMDKIYDFVTQKKNNDYPPLTDAQKEDMSEDEIAKWEKKSKQGILRNDSEMRTFMDNMNQAIFGDKMKELNNMGILSASNYNDRGQLRIDEEKFTKALQNNPDKVYGLLVKGGKEYGTLVKGTNGNPDKYVSVLENMKDTMYKYMGTSSSIFAKKAGLEKTASATNNLYSEQLKRQQDIIKTLQRKMQERENQLYKKFATLESSMNKFNSQMNYLMGN